MTSPDEAWPQARERLATLAHVADVQVLKEDRRAQRLRADKSLHELRASVHRKDAAAIRLALARVEAREAEVARLRNCLNTVERLSHDSRNMGMLRAQIKAALNGETE